MDTIRETKDLNVLNSISRYIVPFYYDDKGDGEDVYRMLRRKIEECHFEANNEFGLAEGKFVENGFVRDLEWDGKVKETAVDMDTYSYLEQMYSIPESGEDDTGVGSSFVYYAKRPTKKAPKTTVIKAVYSDKLGLAADINITDLGIILYKNGIGFIWYETDIAKIARFDVENLRTNDGKELSAKQKKAKTKELLIESCAECGEKIAFELFRDLNANLKELARDDAGLEVIIPKDSDAADENSEAETEKSVTNVDKVSVDQAFGKWLSELVNVIVYGRANLQEKDSKKLPICFWAEKYKSYFGKKGILQVPDNALIYNFIYTDGCGSKEPAAFVISNGYDERYNPPEKIDCFVPFENSVFFSSASGMTYVVEQRARTDGYFGQKGREGFYNSFTRNYFLMYNLLLFQTYSCANYSRLMTDKMPVDVKDFEENKKYMESLETLEKDINLFLVKSILGSVSNIEHQNGFFSYVKRRMSLDENIQSLTIGLDAVHGIEHERDERVRREEKEREEENRLKLEEERRIEKEQEEEIKEKEQTRREIRDSRINIGMAVFGIMSIFSILCDAFALLDWFGLRQSGVTEDGSAVTWFVIGAWPYVSIGLLFLAGLILAIYFIAKVPSSVDKSKDKRKK